MVRGMFAFYMSDIELLSKTKSHFYNVFCRGIRNNVTWNTQALGISSKSLPSSLPFLSCPSTSDGDELRSQQTPAHSSPHAPQIFSSRTISKHKRLQQQSTAPHSSQLNQPQTERIRDNNNQQREMGYSTSTEILEAACNESIPGLTGVSNFTVFLYCKLFDGESGSDNLTVAQMGLDLHATCSDAAWYLSAAEEDFLWVHVCSEFFAHEFNNTVCANSSFWLQRAHQVMGHFMINEHVISWDLFHKCLWHGKVCIFVFTYSSFYFMLTLCYITIFRLH